MNVVQSTMNKMPETMNYLINHPNVPYESHTREGVQKLLDEKKISLNTEIWTEHWGKWQKIRDTDFNPNFKENAGSDNLEDANIALIILSLLFPIAGFVLFFTHFKSSRKNAMRYASFGFLGVSIARLLTYYLN